LTKLANNEAIGVINKLLGALFGGLKIALILSVLLLVFDRFNNTLSLVSEEELEDSILYKPVASIAPMILPQFINEDKKLEIPKIKNSEQE
jgi:membrane protein required for colicin V production